MCPTGTSSDTKTIQRSNLRSAFDVLDVDGDGKISYDDLRTFYGGISGPATSDEDVIGSMMSVADSNKDGYVQYEEFEKVLNGKKSLPKKNGRASVMEEAFRVMDRDGDGRVGLEDLRGYMNWAGFEAHDEDFKAMIRLAGGDESGGVTLEGLIKILAV